MLHVPLNELTRKDTEWHWGQKQQEAFEILKARVTSEPVLAHPELDKQFELEVDASGFAIGGVLLQKKADGKKHPIAYYSSTLSTAERNHDIYDLELLAIIRSLDNWRPLLQGPLTRSLSTQIIRICNTGGSLKRLADE